jgi:hypothetical protein
MHDLKQESTLIESIQVTNEMPQKEAYTKEQKRLKMIVMRES